MNVTKPKAAAHMKGTAPPKAFVAAPPMTGPTAMAAPITVRNLPIATARAGPTGVASAMQLDSTELLVEKRPPTMWMAAKMVKLGANARDAVSMTKAKQLARMTGRRPVVSDMVDNMGEAMNSVKCRNAAMVPTAVAAASMP